MESTKLKSIPLWQKRKTLREKKKQTLKQILCEPMQKSIWVDISHEAASLTVTSTFSLTHPYSLHISNWIYESSFVSPFFPGSSIWRTVCPTLGSFLRLTQPRHRGLVSLTLLPTDSTFKVHCMGEFLTISKF